jgi:predicted nuclease of predicted toxin-antitoxin system
LKFLVDAQLPPSLARWISSRGHEATHVFDIAMHTAGDAAIWAYAGANGCVLLTKDEDFVDRWLLSAAPIALVWIRKGNPLSRTRELSRELPIEIARRDQRLVIALANQLSVP